MGLTLVLVVAPVSPVGRRNGRGIVNPVVLERLQCLCLGEFGIALRSDMGFALAVGVLGLLKDTK